MNILIVDDSQLKASRLSECITSINKEAAVHIETNARDGFLALARSSFQLVLVDVNLPLAANVEPCDQGSSWFLSEVVRKIPEDTRPFIVGTTQHGELLSDAQKTFNQYLWCVIYFDSRGVDWQRQVAQAMALSSRVTRGNLGACSIAVDVAVIAALRVPEFNELLKVLGPTERFVVKETKECWLRATIKQENGREISVIAACADDMGSCAMAALTTRLCITTRPRLLVLVGIMGGNAKRLAIGDIVCIDETWDFRAGKITATGFEPDVRCQRASQKLVTAMRGLVSEEALESSWKRWHGAKPEAPSKLHIGAVACSPAVVSNGSVFQEIEEQKRKTLGVEMEAFGCYDAARRLGDQAPEVLCVKAVCDLGDQTKDDRFQQYCAYISAHLVMTSLKSGALYL